MKILIVDDEPLARQLIRNYLSDQPDFEVAGECENGFDALKFIRENNPDVVFLDIQMPKLSGFEMLEVLDNRPFIIFTTAFDQYAIRAFEENAVDYLLKPFSKERILSALRKIQSSDLKNENQAAIEKLREVQPNANHSLERIVVKNGSKIEVIPVEKVCYIEAEDDYVMIHTEKERYLKDRTMNYFSTNLPQNSFVRIHRKYIIKIDQIKNIEQYNKDSHLIVLSCGAKLRASIEGYRKLKELL